MIKRTNLLTLKPKTLDHNIIDRINQRQVQMLIHSCIYYTFQTSVIPDATFDRWAKELVQLQSQYPEETKQTLYYTQFIGWDGTTGYRLNTYMWEKKAKWLIEQYDKK